LGYPAPSWSFCREKSEEQILSAAHYFELISPKLSHPGTFTPLTAQRAKKIKIIKLDFSHTFLSAVMRVI